MDFLPFLGDSVGFLYNIPNLKYRDGKTGIPRLRLGRNTLVNIFLGNILYWNDDAVVNDNPNVLLPDEQIQLVIRSDFAGSSSSKLKILRKFRKTI